MSEEFEQYSVITDHELDQIYKEITAADTNASNGGFLILVGEGLLEP